MKGVGLSLMILGGIMCVFGLFIIDLMKLTDSDEAKGALFRLWFFHRSSIMAFGGVMAIVGAILFVQPQKERKLIVRRRKLSQSGSGTRPAIRRRR